MKNRKRSGMIAAATVAASVALMFGASAPASAGGIGDVNEIFINCPSNMVARISFKAASGGYVSWNHGQEITPFSKTTATHYIYSYWSGRVSFFMITFVGDPTNVYLTCVV